MHDRRSHHGHRPVDRHPHLLRGSSVLDRKTMTDKQPTALRLATKMDFMLGWDCCKEAAAELRRLHQSEREGWRYAQELKQDYQRLLDKHNALAINARRYRDINVQLLEALVSFTKSGYIKHQHPKRYAKAVAAIAAAR